MRDLDKKIEINGNLCHDLLIKKTVGKLAYNENNDYFTWKKQVREKLYELLGIAKIQENACPLKLTVEEDILKGEYRRIRFVFESEVGAFVPCYLLIPLTGKEKYPVAITLQGHSTGFHNSIGEPKYEGDEESIGIANFAEQAVENGYAALCIEQRAMGERKSPIGTLRGLMCSFVSMRALILGRTILGERVWDVMKAIDLLNNFEMLDTDKILITGNSGGGTMSFYAACIDERIKISAPSCAFCNYDKSILDNYHCLCNFIPDAYNWFEMEDLSCLIAPRNLAIIAGKEDPLFLIDGVYDAFETAKKVFTEEKVPENLSLTLTPYAHKWRPEYVWPTINAVTKQLGWIEE